MLFEFCRTKKEDTFMKKSIAIIMLLTMVFCLTACGVKTETTTNESSKIETTSVEQNDETTSVEQNDETTESTTTNEENWTKEYYVDEFNEPTDEWYISSSFLGTFSNSATNNSALSGYVLVDAENVAFILYEYNRNQVKNVYSHAESYTIVARSDKGEQTFNGYIYSEGDRIVVEQNSVGQMKNLLKTGGEIKFYIYETDNSVTNYLFKLQSSNLNDLLG